MTDTSSQPQVKPWRRRPWALGPEGQASQTIWAAAGFAVILAALGSMIAKAGDDVGVHAFLREQSLPSKVKGTARMPPLFVPPSGKRVLGYAPSYSDRANVFDSMQNEEQRTNSRQPGGAPLPPLRRLTRKAIASSNSSGLPYATKYCVRLCDGFFFPLSVNSSDTGIGQATCSNLCPSSETRLFSAPSGSDSIELASAKGVAYSRLPNAYAYRKQVSKSCTCTASGMGLNNPSIRDDYTLRRGDLIATAKGARAFRGQAPSLSRLSSVWSIEASVRTKVTANLDQLLGTLQNQGSARLKRADLTPSPGQRMRILTAKSGFEGIETLAVAALEGRGKIMPVEMVPREWTNVIVRR